MELEGYAANVQVDFGQPLSEAECRGIVSRLLEDVATGCLDSGGKLIGHVKCFAETPDGSYLYGSVTSPKRGASCQGSGDRGSGSTSNDGSGADIADAAGWAASKLSLDLNVLVYGIPWAATDSVVHKVLRDLSRGGSCRSEVVYPSR